MKTIKYLFMALLMTGFSTAATAQNENDAVIAEISNVLKSKPADLKDALKPFKKAMKQPEVLTAMSDVFLELGDTANAKTYVQMALDRDSKYAPAYIQLGDIEATGTDGGEAAKNYEQAIYLDPKNPDAYYKYAVVYSNISPAQAVSKLDELRNHRPDVAVDAMIGHVYYISNEFEKAAEAYAKADQKAMEERYEKEYAMALYFTKKYDESLKVVDIADDDDPNDGVYFRLNLFNYTELKKFDQALEAAAKLFNNASDVTISYMDYTYYGNALAGSGDHQKAIEQYKKALTSEGLDSNAKRAGVMKTLSDAYKQIGDFDAAADTYKKYVELLGTNTATDMAGLANIYVQHGDALTDSVAKMEKLAQAEAVYADMAEKIPDAVQYATFWRARVNVMMDPESKAALAKPHYEKLVELILANDGERSKSDKARLVESYRYLGAYYWLVVNDKETADTFFNKILEIDPENPVAIQALGIGADKGKKK